LLKKQESHSINHQGFNAEAFVVESIGPQFVPIYAHFPEPKVVFPVQQHFTTPRDKKSVRVIIEIQNNLQRDDGQGSRAVCQHKGLAEGCSHVEKKTDAQPCAEIWSDAKLKDPVHIYRHFFLIFFYYSNGQY
jgi:hypothetical protein